MSLRLTPSKTGMKFYCCYTPSHKILFDRFFLPSLPNGIDFIPVCVDQNGKGDYLSEEFMSCLRQKVDLIRESLAQDDLVVWSDVDIFFRQRGLGEKSFVEELESAMSRQGDDILFLREDPARAGINEGFFVCRSSLKMRAFWKGIADALAARPGWHDQDAINAEFLGDNSLAVQWGYLPSSFYARSQGLPPPSDIILWHANCTLGENAIAQKIRQLALGQCYFKAGALRRRWTQWKLLSTTEKKEWVAASKRRLLKFKLFKLANGIRHLIFNFSLRWPKLLKAPSVD